MSVIQLSTCSRHIQVTGSMLNVQSLVGLHHSVHIHVERGGGRAPPPPLSSTVCVCVWIQWRSWFVLLNMNEFLDTGTEGSMFVQSGRTRYPQFTPNASAVRLPSVPLLSVRIAASKMRRASYVNTTSDVQLWKKCGRLLLCVVFRLKWLESSTTSLT